MLYISHLKDLQVSNASSPDICFHTNQYEALFQKSNLFAASLNGNRKRSEPTDRASKIVVLSFQKRRDKIDTRMKK